MQIFDVLIIGAGIIGCATARELAKYVADIAVIEKNSDVSEGVSKGNSGIVHAGHDAAPDSLKAYYNVLGNSMYADLARELDFPFKHNGAFVACFEEDTSGLLKLYERGIRNGVEGLSIISGDEARELEPSLGSVKSALFAKTSGITSPYGATIALAENAQANGVSFFLGEKVTGIIGGSLGWRVVTEKGEYEAKVVINAAGLYADEIHNMVCDKKLLIVPRKGEYLLFDREVGGAFSRTVFQLPTKMGKGMLVTPSIDGNMLIGPTANDIEDKESFDTTSEGYTKILQDAKRIWPGLPKGKIISGFAGLRPNAGGDFIIGQPEGVQNFIDICGIDSPGLTSAPAIAADVAKKVADILGAGKRLGFIGVRRSIAPFRKMEDREKKAAIAKDAMYGNIVCRCEQVSEAEVVEAIKRGARTIDGVKRRTRVTMGRCQGGFCRDRVMHILSRELSIPLDKIVVSGEDSWVLSGRIKQDGYEG